MKSAKKKINKTISMNVLVHDKLDEYCTNKQVAASKVIEQLVANFLLRQVKETENT